MTPDGVEKLITTIREKADQLRFALLVFDGSSFSLGDQYDPIQVTGHLEITKAGLVKDANVFTEATNQPLDLCGGH